MPRCVKAARRRTALPAGFFCLLLTAAVSAAQEPRAGDGREQFAPSVIASTAEGRVRFAAPNEVVRLELEVLSEGGQTLFEATTKGSVLDWTLQDAGGERLTAGSYLCVLTVKGHAGRITQRLGMVEVTAEGRAAVRPAEAVQMSAAQAEAVGPVASDAALAVSEPGGTGEATVLAHDGTEGQLTRTRGALSFRVGDFFSGRDREQMRLTEDGRLGLGTSKPEATLDVAGAVRAAEGFRFADGTTLNSEGGRLTFTNASGDALPAAGAAGTGTVNRLAKWAETGGAGTLTDSAIFESGGNIGVNTSSPEGTFHMQSPDTTVFKVVSSGTAQTGRALFQMYRGASAQATGWDFGYNTDLGSENFLVRELTNGAPATRLTLQKGTGNFGVGTSAPATKLHVNGVEEGIRVQGPAAGDANLAYVHFVDGAGTHIGYVGDGSTGDKNVFLGSYIGDASLVTQAGRILTATAGGRVGIGTTTPQATLDVRGDIRLGSGGQYRATSSEESLRIVRGVVDGLNSDPPEVVAGRGFSVSKLSRGDYQITFDTCFPAPPTVVATAAQAHPTVPVAVLSERCGFQIHVEDDLDRYFHFIAIGVR